MNAWCRALILALSLFSFSFSTSVAQDKKPVVAVFSLDGPVLEKPVGDDFLFGSVGGEPLKDLLQRMKKARDDDNVKGVVVLLGNATIGRAQLEEIRAVMKEIRAAGKEIHAHADFLSTGSLMLLSGASKLSVVPTGHCIITGIMAEQVFVRGLLDLIGVKPDFLTCGDYKSAGETFMRKSPSPQAEAMMNWLFDGLYDGAVKLIAEGRGVDEAKARAWIDRGIYSAESAKKAGIIDAVQYRQQFVAGLKKQYGEHVRFDKKYGKKKSAQIDLSSPFGILQFYADLLAGPKKSKSDKPAVAIVYVEGGIVPGKPGGSPLGAVGGAYSTPIRKALEKAAADGSVKAVVLRIDSPGGSAVASEIILNATRQVAAKKPFVVSMGNVAGSGGYYVACGADTIFADPSTITGSIGVLTGKFATTGMWNKAGITFKSYQRGANAGLLASDAVFTDKEKRQLQSWMDEVYEVFKGHVVKARGKRLKKDIEELAGGRVYTGRQALELGLVDKLGGLDDAIQFIAKKAKIEDYDVKIVPRPKNFLELLMSDLTGEKSDDNSLEMAEQSPRLSPKFSLMDAALPYLKGLEPGRVDAVKRALEQLTLFQRERVLLTMPVMRVVD